jgi:hypothetical protein
MWDQPYDKSGLIRIHASSPFLYIELRLFCVSSLLYCKKKTRVRYARAVYAEATVLMRAMCFVDGWLDNYNCIQKRYLHKYRCLANKVEGPSGRGSSRCFLFSSERASIFQSFCEKRKVENGRRDESQILSMEPHFVPGTKPRYTSPWKKSS